MNGGDCPSTGKLVQNCQLRKQSGSRVLGRRCATVGAARRISQVSTIDDAAGSCRGISIPLWPLSGYSCKRSCLMDADL